MARPAYPASRPGVRSSIAWAPESETMLAVAAIEKRLTRGLIDIAPSWLRRPVVDQAFNMNGI